MFELAYYFSNFNNVMKFGDIFELDSQRNLSPCLNSQNYKKNQFPIKERNELLLLSKLKVFQRE